MILSNTVIVRETLSQEFDIACRRLHRRADAAGCTTAGRRFVLAGTVGAVYGTDLVLGVGASKPLTLKLLASTTRDMVFE